MHEHESSGQTSKFIVLYYLEIVFIESMSFAKQTFAKQTFAKQITLVKQWAGLIVCVNTLQKTSGDSAINLKKVYIHAGLKLYPYLGIFWWKIDVI